MIRFFAILLSGTLVSGCSFGGPVSSYPGYQPNYGQGQYVRPEWLNPQPTQRIHNIDACEARLYAGLVGQHEGSIFISGLPGRKRIIKPAESETFGYSPDDTFYEQLPYVEVREFLAGQSLYASTISNMRDRTNLGPEIQDRLTIELDEEGYVQQVDCR